jgi:hypothetical protein
VEVKQDQGGAEVMTKVWIVQQWVKGVWGERKQQWEDSVFEFTGVFDTEEKAVAACRDKNYCVAPITVNEPFPHEKVEIPGSHYPIRE